MLNRFNSRLDIIEDLFGSGDYCECSPFSPLWTWGELFNKVWLKMTGEKVDFGEIPDRPCLHEVQDKTCNPKPIELYVPPTREKNLRTIEKVQRLLCEVMGRDYEVWEAGQEEPEKHIAMEPWREKKEDPEQLSVLPSLRQGADSLTESASEPKLIRDRQFYEDKLKAQSTDDPIRNSIAARLLMPATTTENKR